jgi:hypothetical protein
LHLLAKLKAKPGGAVEAIKLLLDIGADPNMKDFLGRKPNL